MDHTCLHEILYPRNSAHRTLYNVDSRAPWHQNSEGQESVIFHKCPWCTITVESHCFIIWGTSFSWITPNISSFWLLFPLLSVPTLTLFPSYQGSQISSYPRSHLHRQEFPLVTLPRIFTEIEGWCFGKAPLVIPNPPRELCHPTHILLRIAALSHGRVLWGSHLLPRFRCPML